ncbi:hypothetical protein CYY_007046 [Polysphondylium violaceum]|uniref:Uncharacterized protein n=1 Tax=Polysphondylium violaceum TaxID=133409 RepID=A0A8J4UY99_9MYCE|nr:hypothetical protein CYY_007046 [Polysphondylium violaceum]
MVRVNCDYIPAWPFLYYKKTTRTILHILWPLITWNESRSGNKVFALFYFLFRITYKERIDTQYFDFFWPIFHFEHNDKGFRFGIRPLMWIISTDSTFKFSLLGIINIFSKHNGDDVWVVIFPLFWYRKKNGNVFWTLAPIIWVRYKDSIDRLLVLVLPLGLFIRGTKGWLMNIAGLFHFSFHDDFTKVFLLPFFTYSNFHSVEKRLTFFVIVHVTWGPTKYRWIVFPIIFCTSKDSDNFFSLYICVVFFYRKRTNFKQLCFMGIYFYQRTMGYTVNIFLLLFFYLRAPNYKYLNILIFFNRHVNSECKRHIFFPFLWIKKKNDSHFIFHLWPLFGFKISQKDNGFAIYFIYPFIAYENYYGGSLKSFHVFFGFIHYCRDLNNSLYRHGITPLYFYRKTPKSVFGQILLYIWYKKVLANQFQMKKFDSSLENSTDIVINRVDETSNSYEKETEVSVDLEKVGYPGNFGNDSDQVQIEKGSIQVHLEKDSDPVHLEKGSDQVHLEKESDPIHLEKESDDTAGYPIKYDESGVPIPPPPPPMKAPGNDIGIDDDSDDIDRRKPSSDNEPKPSELDKDFEYGFKLYSLLPIFWYIKKDEFNSNRYIFFLPFFIMRWCKDIQSSYFLSLIYYQRKDSVTTRICPVFYQKQTLTRTLILSPIYIFWRREGNSFKLILPLFVDVHKSETHIMVLVFPIFVYYRKSIFKFVTLFPFFFRGQDASKGELFTYFFPIYGKSSKGKETNRYFLFPIFSFKRKPEKEFVSIDLFFPFFHYDRSGIDGSYSARILPFYWRSFNPVNEFLLIMPFFWKFVTDKDSRPQKNTLCLPFYFYRDSAEYEFTFATPALLPPYYIHYHREQSQVEQTYFYPFFAHKIKGNDHLRWILLILYRHTWKDFSDYMTMNILFYFKHRSEKWKISGVFPLWVQWHNNLENKYHLRVLFLVAYDRLMSATKAKTRLSFFWILLIKAGLFYRKVTKFAPPPSGDNPDASPEISQLGTKTYFLLLFHKKFNSYTDYSHFSLLWLFKSFISFIYVEKHGKDSLFYVFLLFFYKRTSSLSRTAVIWLFHPIASLFLRESTPFTIITRFFPLFWVRSTPDRVHNDDSIPGKASIQSRAVSILYIVPNFGLINYRRTQQKFALYFLPLFYYRKCKRDYSTIFSLFWFAVPHFSLFNYTREGEIVRHRVFPIYYRISSDCDHGHGTYINLLSIVWLGHPVVALYRFHKTHHNRVICFFPVFWSKYTYATEAFHLSILYIVRKFGFIDYWRNPDFTRFYILFFFFSCNEDNTRLYSLIYLVHPKVSFICYKGSTTKTKFRIALIFYFNNSTHDDIARCHNELAILYLGHPKVSFIGYWSRHTVAHFHIVLLLWVSKIESYTQVGIFWIGAAKSSLYNNPYVNQGIVKKVYSLWYPLSLFLYYDDGAYKTLHLMPIFKYSSQTQKELDKFWLLGGAVYFRSRGDVSEFRWFYRWIRVKSGNTEFVFEFNPFVAYKKKRGETKLLILGGMCGCYSSFCRVCCIEC